MKKIFATIAAVVLFAPLALALPNEQPNELSNSTFSTAQSTPVAQAALLKYVVLETTGSVTGGTLTIRDGATDKLAVAIGTSAGSQVIDLSEAPVLFKSSINLSASVTDGGVSYSIIYQKSY